MPLALAQVKQAFGADAAILHTRTFKRGGILGIGARTYVEITAARGTEVAQARKPRRPAPGSPGSPGASALPAARRAAPSREPEPSQGVSAGELIRRTYLAAQAEMQAEMRQPRQAAVTELPRRAHGSHEFEAREPGARESEVSVAASAYPGVAFGSAPVEARSPMNDLLADELRVVKRMVAKMARQQREQGGKGKGRASAGGELPDKLFDQYLTLLQQEVTEELAEEVIQEVKASLPASEHDDEAKVRQSVGDALTKLVPVDDSEAIQGSRADGRPRTIALIGPTGVGKTTTIAKLAANFKLREKKSVGLITIDTYRIAAVDQLRTYANIIGVPLHVISSPQEMREAHAKLAHCDVVLIDTAGRSQRDDPRLEQLRQFVDAASPHEVHLVLSSTCTQTALLDAVDRFSQIRVDRIIFTKLDEAVTFGVILNVARKVNKRLSYLTTGQEVPHQIEVSRPRRLAALVLGEGL